MDSMYILHTIGARQSEGKVGTNRVSDFKLSEHIVMKVCNVLRNA
jgi:hypothetical protein